MSGVFDAASPRPASIARASRASDPDLDAIREALRAAELDRPCDLYPEDSEYNCIAHPVVNGEVCGPCAIRALLSALDEARRENERTQYELDCAVDERERSDGRLCDLTDVVNAARGLVGAMKNLDMDGHSDGCAACILIAALEALDG